MTPITVLVPMRTVSETNMREHHMARHRRRKAQREAAYWTMAAALGVSWEVPGRVVLTRLAARRLDDDNLRGALKAVRDGVADALHVDDGSDVVLWDYLQRKPSKTEPKMGVEIRIESKGGAT